MANDKPKTATENVVIEPRGDRLLVRRQKAEEQKGRIVIPDQAREKPSRGIVVAVGPGRLLESGTRVPVDIEPGDDVLFGKWSGTDIKVGDVEELLLIREDEVFGVVRVRT